MPEQSKTTVAHYDLPSLQEEVVKNPSTGIQITIDQQIASLENVDLHALRTMRNRCSPISSLPAETLAEIFVILVEPVGLYTPQTWQKHVELTRVCTHWRNVAMQCPAYWACPPLTHVKGPVSRLEEILARSKDYPLSIRMGIVCSPPPAQPIPNAIIAPDTLSNDHSSDSERIGTGPMLSLLQAQAYRIRELHLKSETLEIYKFQDLLAEDTPVLESLDIRLTRPTSSQFEPIMFEAPGLQSRFTLDYVLNTHTMPSLRYLRLNYRAHPINWTTAPPSSRSYLSTQNLTSLILSTDPTTRDAAPPWALILDIIRATAPHLQTLHLFDCIANANDTHAFFAEALTTLTPTRHRIHLPCLTSIKIQEGLFPLLNFLSWIILPLQDLDIDLSVVERVRAEDFVYFSLLRDRSTCIRDLLLWCGLKSRFPMEEEQVIQRIGLGGDAAVSVRRYEVMNLVVDRADTVHLRLFDRADASSPNTDFGIHLNHNKTSLSLKFFNVGHTTSLLQHLDLGTLPYCEGGDCPSEVQLIYLNLLNHPESDPNYDDRPPVDWASFFSRHTSIQTLRLRAEEQDLYDVLSALGVGPGSSDLDLPLPDLNSLVFEGQTIGPSSSGIKNYTSLATILSGRRNQQCLPIPCIRLGAGFGPTQALDSLQDEMKDKIKESNGGGDVSWG